MPDLRSHTAYPIKLPQNPTSVVRFRTKPAPHAIKGLIINTFFGDFVSVDVGRCNVYKNVP